MASGCRGGQKKTARSLLAPRALARPRCGGPQDETQPIDPAAQVFDGSKIAGPSALRQWLLGYSDQFVEVVAEKLLTYALGRGVEYQDMPLVRAIAREAGRNNNRFWALIIAVV